MGSLKVVLLVYTTLLVVAFGETSNTPTPVPTPSSTSRVPSPTSLVPNPTSTPPMPKYTYVNNTGSCRIVLSANMIVIFTYNDTDNETRSETETLDGIAVVDNATSYCNYRNSAALILTWNNTVNVSRSRSLSFNFTGGSAQGSQAWQFKNLTLTFDFDDRDFPRYPTHISSTYANYSMGGFFDDVSSNVEYQRSYSCKTLSQYNFTNYTNLELDVSINVTNFQVQAFEFKNKAQFGNARVCVADGTPGSKIVPIAVGAALGVLVIAVIIAYIISKVVNRKKSSYEAL